MNGSGFLGTNAPLLIDINITVQIIFYLILCAGIVAQRKNKFHWHDKLQTTAVVGNLFFIIFIMVPSFGNVVGGIPDRLTQTFVLVPTIHAVLGILAEGLAIYCMLAGFKILPRKIGVLRYWMWTTFILWTASIIFGIGTYLVFYAGFGSSGNTDVVSEHIEEPITTPGEGTATPDSLIAEHSEEQVAEHAEEAGVDATQAPDEIVGEHAEEPITGPTLAPTPTTIPEVVEIVQVGTLQFSDNASRNDQVSLQLSGLTSAEVDYQAWLMGEAVDPLDLGALIIEGDNASLSFNDPDGRDLLALYNAVAVTEAGDETMVYFQGEIAMPVMQHIRHVLAAFSDTPNNVGFAVGAFEQGAIVLEHAGFQQQAIAEANVPNLRFHAEHLVNVIDGENGPNFGDKDNNGEITNPGDGYGLLGDNGYIAQAINHANLAANAEGATDNVILHAGHVEIAGANATDLYQTLLSEQLKLSIEDTTGGNVPTMVADSLTWAGQGLAGIDQNGNGQIEPIAGEGTLQTLYQHAQLMAIIPIFNTDSMPTSGTPATDAPAMVDFSWQAQTASNAGPGARYDHAVAYNAASNQVFVFGGRDGNQVYNDVWALDISTLSWQQVAVDSPTAPTARYSTEMIVDSSGQNLYVATGQVQGGSVLNDIWQLDLVSETWTDLSASAGPAPEARYGNPGGNINDNLVVTHGFGSTRYDDTWQFNTTTKTWENITPAGDVPLRRCLFASATTGNTLIMHGGCASGFGDCFLEDTWILDSTGAGWRELISEVKPAGRQHQSITAVNDTQAILFGGQDASRAALDDLWLLDTAAESWQPISGVTGPAARFNHKAVAIPGMGLLVHGGRNGNGPLDDMWLLSVPDGMITIDTSPDTSDEPTEDIIDDHSEDIVDDHGEAIEQPESAEPEPTATPELVDEHADDPVSEHAGN